MKYENNKVRTVPIEKSQKLRGKLDTSSKQLHDLVQSLQ